MRKIVKTQGLIFISLLILSGVGFFLRFKGLGTNYSFWIDEASSATFARAIWERGVPVLSSGYAAHDYALHFYLLAASFKILGLNEFAARLPSVIFGVLTIPLVYWLGKRYVDFRVGLLAAFLVTFSVLEITYSRQARAYQELQFFSLLTVLAFVLVLQVYDQGRLKLTHLLFLLAAFALSALTHKFALLFLIAAVVFLILVRRDIWENYRQKYLVFLKKRGWLAIGLTLLSLFLLLVSLKYFNFYKAFRETTTDFWANKFALTPSQYWEIVLAHLKYYHSFFWRQYPHISFFAFLGLILGIRKNWRLTSLFLIIIAVHLGFVIFRVFPQFVRYVYLIFPFFLILASSFLVWVVDCLPLKKPWGKSFLLVFLAFFFVLNGNKFTFLPKSFYSLNFDMTEVPEPDFKSVYAIIKNKTDNFKFKAVVLDNRTDASQWYLGEGKPDYYLVGPKELEPAWNLKRGVLKDPVSGAIYLTELGQLKRIIASSQKGFVVFEVRALEYVKVDNELIDYVRENLKNESRIEHVAGNNLSIWPIELYSWGF